MVYRDALYRMSGGSLVLELDGRGYHDDPQQRERDLRRDLAVAATSRPTVRLGWGQVFGDPCHTAAMLARILRALGWPGSPSRAERPAAYDVVRWIRRRMCVRSTTQRFAAYRPGQPNGRTAHLL